MIIKNSKSQNPNPKTQTPSPIYIIVGPTASGKTAKALDLASKCDGVIINCDSVQIYDGLSILTAQPSDEERATAPHELYGTLHPNDVCSAGNWREMVEPLINDILEREQTPIIVGGTGLYIKALMEGLSPIPDIPDDIREAVVEKHTQLGPDAFYAELETRDPEMAARYHPNHKARLIRAMEVLEATGQSLAEWQKLDRLPPPENWEFKVDVILPERDALYQRCNDRFLWMLENGALEQVKEFSKRIEDGDVKEGVPLEKALGFKALRAYMRGDMSKDDAIERSQAETRQYAKRQTTWFRNQL